MRRSIREKLKNKYVYSVKNTEKRFSKKLNNKLPIILWIDHSLGGGTETYTRNQFCDLMKTNNVIRMQYWPWIKQYSMTYGTNKKTIVYKKTLSDIFEYLQKLNISEIVVNNLVGYENSASVLQFVKQIKSIYGCVVSFRGHDFHCYCPSVNMIDCDDKYCNFQHSKGCEYCWKQKMQHIDKLLHCGVSSVSAWRYDWGDFFTNTVDHVIVFSEKIKDMFLQMYPQISGKTIVIPHKIKKLPIVKIKKHNTINIASIGDIQPNKGSYIINEISKILPDDKSVKLFIIGNISPKPETKNITITGRYKQSQLPKLIKKHQIDIIFIASIWPETFSYTTSETISMGIPVACYNIGAPSERVSKYKHGLVLSEIDAQKNLIEIIDFVKKIKKTK